MGWISGIGILIALCGRYLFLSGMQKGPNNEKPKNSKTYLTVGVVLKCIGIFMFIGGLR